MDNNNAPNTKPSNAYEEALKAEQNALKKLDELEDEREKWIKILKEAQSRKEYLSKTSQPKTRVSPRRKPTAMSARSPGKPNGMNNSRLVKTALNDEGELVQTFEEAEPQISTAAAKPKIGGCNESNVNMVENQQPNNSETPLSIPAELPSCPGYDPLQSLAPHRYTTVLKDLASEFKNLYYQSNLPDNAVKFPVKETIESHNYYLRKFPDFRKSEITKMIEKLGGKVVENLEDASVVIFSPSAKKPDDNELFFLLTAAAGGRFIVPVAYITECSDAKKFLNPEEYATCEYHESKQDLHPTISGALKMSAHFRKLYSKNANPYFYLHNVLFAEPKGTHEDVMLFLRICGAYVQPFYGIQNPEEECISNFTFTMVVNSGKISMTDSLKDALKYFPQTTPDDLRKTLWQTLDKYMQ